MSYVDKPTDFLTPNDIAMLRWEGDLTPPSFSRLQQAGYIVTGNDQVVIAGEIAQRFKNGQTQLPELLKNVLVSDIHTRRMIQTQLRKQIADATSAVTEPVTVTEQPQPPVVQPAPHHQFTPSGHTVAPAKFLEQRSDASFRAGETVKFLFEPTTREPPLNQPGGSWVEALKVHEQLEPHEFEQLLPHSFGEIESLLRNDGYLSDEEIVRALYDETLKKQTLAEHVRQYDPELPATFQEKLTMYLWALHEHIQESPLTPALSSGLLASQFDLLLPEHAEQLRQPLTEGGYLNSPSISTALFDTGLERATLNQLIVEHNPSADPGVQLKLAHYLWDVHKSVVDQPLINQLNSSLRYRIVADRKALPDKANTFRLPGAATPGVEAPDLRRQRLDGCRAREAGGNQQTRKPGLLRTALGLRTFEGGMLANLVHNYKIMTQLGERLFTVKQSAIDQPAQKQPAMNNAAEVAPRWDWKQIEQEATRIGLSRQTLEQNGSLNDFLQGRRTGLMNVQYDDGTGTVTPMTGKLYITEIPGKGPTIHIQAEQNDIRLPRTFLGHELTPKDTNSLLKTGEMGRLVDLRDKVTGDAFKGYIALDRDVKRLTVLRADRICMPTKLKGVELSPKQQADLKAGLPVRVDGLKNESGLTYNAFVQVSAAKRSFRFTRIPEQAQKQTAGQQPKTDPQATQAPETKAKSVNKKEVPPQVQPGDQKKDVSVVAKNGTSRTTTQTSKAGRGTTKSKTPNVAITTTETTVNGRKAAKTQKPKKIVNRPKQ